MKHEVTSMTHIDEIKHRLLRAVVQENTRTKQSHGTPGMPRSRRTGGLGRRQILWALAVVFFLISSYMIWADAAVQGRLRSVVAFVVRVTATVVSSRTVQLKQQPEPTYQAPGPFDFRVFPLQVKTIVLDPGHGGVDGGAVTSHGLIEKDLTLDISHRLRRLLEAASFEVLMTRRKDETVSLSERVTFANTKRADLFVSIHVNWFDTSTPRGAETYYLGPTDDPHVLRLAALENRQARYSLGEFRRLLESVYLDVKRQESYRLAAAVQHELARFLHKHDHSVVDRGVKMAPFLVLATTQMPAVLAEVSYLSNHEEARLLATQTYRQQIAQAIYNGIRAYAAVLHNRSAHKGS